MCEGGPVVARRRLCVVFLTRFLDCFCEFDGNVLVNTLIQRRVSVPFRVFRATNGTVAAEVCSTLSALRLASLLCHASLPLSRLCRRCRVQGGSK